MASDIIVFEILCCLRCKYGLVHNLMLQSAIVGFCETEEICNAKRIVCETAEQVNADFFRPKVRQGDGKKKKECGDLIATYELLDKNKCALPRFVALDVKKIPCVKAAEADLVTVLKKVSEL
jgi:hypothetical protein